MPTISYLIVGGGGSGGKTEDSPFGGAGGGGAGRVRSGTVVLGEGTYPVAVGLGGASVVDAGAAAGLDGQPSSFEGIVAEGGGGGGGNTTLLADGRPGGSGGGAGSTTGGSNPGGAAAGAGGNAGGASRNASSDADRMGGGGGGAGAAGSSAVGGNGDGGAGSSSSITGTADLYAGGGGGSGRLAGTAGAGGTGGGGSGATGTVAGTFVAATAGANGKGAGGGGANDGPSGAGGSGVVILAYPTSEGTSSGGVVTFVDGMTIHTFLSGGNFIFLAPTEAQARLDKASRRHVHRDVFVHVQWPTVEKRYHLGTGKVTVGGFVWEGVNSISRRQLVELGDIQEPWFGTAPLIDAVFSGIDRAFLREMWTRDDIAGTIADVYWAAFNQETGEEVIPLTLVFPGRLGPPAIDMGTNVVRSVSITIESLNEGMNFPAPAMDWSPAGQRQRYPGDKGMDTIGSDIVTIFEPSEEAEE
jgi:hypothetical protein